MAKKYENVEKILGLLDDEQLGGLQKRLASTEKSLSEIMKKLSVIETEKAEREAAEAAARAEEAARIAAEEAAKAAAAAAAAQKAQETQSAPEVEKPKKTMKKKAETVKEETPVEEKTEEQAVSEAPIVPKAEESAEEKAEEKAEAKTDNKTDAKARTFVPQAPAAPAGPRAPRYFRNGQEQGVYVAKPGVDPNASTTYRPRPVGDRPARPQGERLSGQRPTQQGARPARPTGSAPIAAPMMPSRENKSFSAPAKKKNFEKTYTEKKPMSKRSLIKQQGMTVEDFDEDKSGYRKLRGPKRAKQKEIPTIKIEHAVVTTKDIPLKVLSEKLGVSAVEITKRLFKEGIMKGINDSIDYDNALMIAMDMGIDLEYKPEKTAEEVLMDTVVAEDESKLVTRAPVVTVMGHVD
ncbi:MAG: translation initiation factor IF-2 N-terminal domain-containing protein, partial [Clostridia bacterium]|nr:translation initiation factor IF-2 N-terminal domain-containing protein [Clostridia bacterium]